MLVKIEANGNIYFVLSKIGFNSVEEKSLSLLITSRSKVWKLDHALVGSFRPPGRANEPPSSYFELLEGALTKAVDLPYTFDLKKALMVLTLSSRSALVALASR